MLKSQEKALDRLIQELVMIARRGMCEYCDISDETLSGHHILGKINRSVRWNLDNMCLLCANHHVIGNFSAHRSPNDFKNWIIEIRGKEWWDKINMLKDKIEWLNYKVIKKNLLIQIKYYKEFNIQHGFN